MVNYDRAILLDLLCLEQLEEECFCEDAFSRRLIKNLLTNTKSIIIKATAPSGKIVGNIIGVRKKGRDSPAGRIFSLCVLKDFRKKGIAARLVQLLEEEYRQIGIKEIRLEVSTRNNTAQLFYKRQGYQVTTTIFRDYYHDGTDAMVMRKDLS